MSGEGAEQRLTVGVEELGDIDCLLDLLFDASNSRPFPSTDEHLRRRTSNIDSIGQMIIAHGRGIDSHGVNSYSYSGLRWYCHSLVVFGAIVGA